MSNAVIEKSELIRNIVNGRLDMSEVKSKISDIEFKYGNDVFPPYSFDIQDKPWDGEYLKKLELQSMSGASSKEFILHLAEVSTELHQKASIKWWMIAGAVAVVVIVIALVVLI